MTQQRTQTSKDNPGWTGRGIPSPSRILNEGAKKAFIAIKGGRLRLAWHITQAASANLYNFHLSRKNEQKVYCPCCQWAGKAFLARANWRAVAFQSACPDCDSRSRHRALMFTLPALLEQKQKGEIIVFAPERVIINALKSQGNSGDIITTDLLSVDVDYPGEDIQSLTFSDNQFAMLICNHVLEHVPDDVKALSECNRILKAGGTAIFTVPGDFDKSVIVEYSKPDDNGHFRHYGTDFIKRLEQCFADVQARNMSLEAPPQWKIRQNELIFVCRK